jgi:hypothetical protein
MVWPRTDGSGLVWPEANGSCLVLPRIDTLTLLAATKVSALCRLQYCFNVTSDDGSSIFLYQANNSYLVWHGIFN